MADSDRVGQNLTKLAHVYTGGKLAKKVEQLVKELAGKDSKLDAMRSQLAQLEPKVAELEAKLASKDVEIALAKREAALQAKEDIAGRIEAAFEKGFNLGRGGRFEVPMSANMNGSSRSGSSIGLSPFE